MATFVATVVLWAASFLFCNKRVKMLRFFFGVSFVSCFWW